MLVGGLGLAVAGCGSSRHQTAAPPSTLGSKSTLPESKGYTCSDPKGDISADTSANGTLTQPSGIDLLEASAHVEGDVLAVKFTTVGPITTVPQPLFDVFQGDIGTAPDFSFELRAQPTGTATAAGPWSVTLHTFKGGNEAKTELSVPVTVTDTTLSYQVPLTQIPPIATLQWQFGSSAVVSTGSVFDDCNSFTTTTTSGGASTTTSG